MTLLATSMAMNVQASPAPVLRSAGVTFFCFFPMKPQSLIHLDMRGGNAAHFFIVDLGARLPTRTAKRIIVSR